MKPSTAAETLDVRDDVPDPALRGLAGGRLLRGQAAAEDPEGTGLRPRCRADPGRDAPRRRAGVGRSRFLCPPRGEGFGLGHAPRASLRDRQGRRSRPHDRRDLRQGHGARPRQGRPHAPVRPVGQLRLHRHRRRRHSARGAAPALAYKKLGSGAVAVAEFGEGASNQGSFHESLNMAGLWKLPCVFVCQDNNYGISVNKANSTAVESIADRAAGYGMPGVRVTENDADLVFAAVGEAVARARARRRADAARGQGRSLLRALPGRPRDVSAEGRGRGAAQEGFARRL